MPAMTLCLPVFCSFVPRESLPLLGVLGLEPDRLPGAELAALPPILLTTKTKSNKHFNTYVAGK